MTSRLLLISPVHNEEAHLEQIADAIAQPDPSAGSVGRRRRPLHRQHARDSDEAGGPDRLSKNRQVRRRFAKDTGRR